MGYKKQEASARLLFFNLVLWNKVQDVARSRWMKPDKRKVVPKTTENVREECANLKCKFVNC